MSGSDETFVNPTEAKSGATDFTVATEALYSTWHSAAGNIRALNTQQPWGNDEPGKQFNENYASGEKYADQALDGGDKVFQKMRQIGPDVREAVAGTVDEDDLIKKWFDQDG